MSFFDPHGVSSRYQNSSYAGQVIRQRPVNYPFQALSQQNIPQMLAYLEQNGYTIYLPGIPNYPTTTMAFSIQDIYINYDNTTFNYIPNEPYFSPDIRLYDAIGQLPHEVLEGLFNLPFPPKSFYFRISIDSFLLQNLQLTSSSTETLFRFALDSTKFNYILSSPYYGDNLWTPIIHYDLKQLLSDKLFATARYPTSTGANIIQFSTDPDAFYNGPGIGGATSTSFSADIPDSIELYNKIKNRDEDINLTLFKFGVVSDSQCTFNFNKCQIGVSYYFSIEY